MKSIYLILLATTLILLSCKSTQAVADKSDNPDTMTEKKTITQKKHFNAATYDPSSIESVSLDANHSANRIHIMEDKVLVIQDTIKQ